MSKFLVNLLLQISKALVNSKIQFLIQKFLIPYFRPDFLPYFFSAQSWPTSSLPVRPTRPVAYSTCLIQPLVHFGRRLLRLSDSAACPIRPLVRFGHRLLRLSDSAIASLSLIGGPTLSVSPGSSPSSDNARARLRRHSSPATERRLALCLGCHRTVNTSPSFSLP
jgi:hypothetical protein